MSGFSSLLGSGNESWPGAVGSNTGNDTIDGQAGDDTIDGGLGDDSLIGGADTDWLDYSAETGNITVTLNSRATLAGGNDSLSSFEVLLSGSGNDSLAGTSSAETIYAGAGNDTYASTPTPNSDSGNDWIEAGLGNDSIYDFGFLLDLYNFF